ncbi:MAG TPA: hypothetical protein VJ692_02600 [Nitrospiraceae bacterium]|nr:hypothetical protein [Nitrospiraceae bacterium]
MFAKNLREGAQEQTEIELRQRALKSLLAMRQKQLRESLDHRIKRARKEGEGENLTRAEWASLHKQEIAHVRVQLADLQLESAHTRGQLSKLKRALNRAKRLRASQSSSTRKRK